MSFDLDCERQELLQIWAGLRQKRWPLQNHPNPALKRLFAIEDVESAHRSSSMDIRHFHDMLGWMAKNKMNCRGAIYRTTSFMSVKADERIGSKPKKGQPFTATHVHMEHSVPAGQLFQAWASLKDRPQSDEEKLHWLLRNSILTAFLRSDVQYIGKGLHKHNPYYLADDESCLPFKRYDGLVKAGVGIINIISGDEIDPDKWTLGHHRDCIMALIAD